MFKHATTVQGLSLPLINLQFQHARTIQLEPAGFGGSNGRMHELLRAITRVRVYEGFAPLTDHRVACTVLSVHDAAGQPVSSRRRVWIDPVVHSKNMRLL